MDNFTLLENALVAIKCCGLLLMYEGYNMVRFAYRGIMDERDEDQDRRIREDT